MKILTKCVFLTELGPNSSIMISIKKVMYIHLSKFSNSILLSVLGAVYVTVREKVILCQNILKISQTYWHLHWPSPSPEWGHGTLDTEHHSHLTIIFNFSFGCYNSIYGDHTITLHSSHTHAFWTTSNITYRSVIVLSEKKRERYSMTRRKRLRIPGSSQGQGAASGTWGKSNVSI